MVASTHLSTHRSAQFIARPKILLLIKSLGLGGAERLLVDALPYLDRVQFDYHVAYVVPWKDALAPRFSAAGYPISCLGATGVGSGQRMNQAGAFTQARPLAAMRLLPRAWTRLNRLQRCQRFDLVHADLPIAGFLARLLSRVHGLPAVYTEHNLQERYHPLTRWANRLTYGWNARVLAVSDEVAASIRRGGLDRRALVIPLLNGVPVEAIRAEAAHGAGLKADLGIAPERPVVGTVAVFRPQKRLLDWLEVAKRVAGLRQDVVFIMVGDGPDMPLIRAKLAELGLQDRVYLTGFREDGRRLMGLMDIYLMTSDYEGLPIALLEAMALAKPVVATAVGGIPEVITHGHEGYLASPGGVEDLVGYILRLLNDPDAARAMGQRGAQKIEHEFHIRRRVRAIEAIYGELLSTSSVSLASASAP